MAAGIMSSAFLEVQGQACNMGSVKSVRVMGWQGRVHIIIISLLFLLIFELFININKPYIYIIHI